VKRHVVLPSYLRMPSGGQKPPDDRMFAGASFCGKDVSVAELLAPCNDDEFAADPAGLVGCQKDHRQRYIIWFSHPS
jgi:hypothetical protein